MSANTVSARYTDLYDYARAAEQMGYDLTDQAGRLASRLAWFEARCVESGISVSGDGLDDALRAYAVNALPIDRRVRQVGQAFQLADAVWRPGPPAIVDKRIDWQRFLLLEGVLVPPLLLTALLPGVTRWVTASVSNFWTAVEAVGDAAAIGALRLSKSKIPGRTGLSAPQWARKVLGLKATHLKETTLVSKFARPGLENSLLIGAAIASWEQWQYDAKAFQGDPVEQWSAYVYDAAIILTATAAVATAGYLAVSAGVGLLALAGISAPAVAVGLAVVGVTLGLGLAVDHFVLDPYLRGGEHQKHVGILADNAREFRRDPTAFTKVFGGEILKRLGDNAAEFKRHPAAYGEAFLVEYARVSGDVLNPIGASIKDHAGQLVDFIMGSPEPPPACVAI